VARGSTKVRRPRRRRTIRVSPRRAEFAARRFGWAAGSGRQKRSPGRSAASCHSRDRRRRRPPAAHFGRSAASRYHRGRNSFAPRAGTHADGVRRHRVPARRNRTASTARVQRLAGCSRHRCADCPWCGAAHNPRYGHAARNEARNRRCADRRPAGHCRWTLATGNPGRRKSDGPRQLPRSDGSRVRADSAGQHGGRAESCRRSAAGYVHPTNRPNSRAGRRPG